MRPVALIVFDLDGTLVDSRKDLADSANELLRTCGAQALSEQAIGRMVGDGAATLVARAFAAAGVPQPADALARFLAFYDARLLAHTRPYPGIPGLLETLRSSHELAVLTNKPIAATRRILDGLNLASCFKPTLVLGGDGPHPRKPDPAGLRTLVTRAGTDEPHTMLVGDSLIDWRTAHAAGVLSCLARYGFGFEGFPMDAICLGDVVIDEPLALLEHL